MDEVAGLLRRWAEGDDTAVGRLTELVLPFVRQRARELLGAELRCKLDSEDVAQDAALEFLKYGPRYVPKDAAQLHALLARIVANTIRDHGSWFRTARRQMGGELPLSTSALLADGSSANPADAVQRRDAEVRLRLALELLDEPDRQALVWHLWDKLTFVQIGERRGVSEEAARAFHRRALVKLLERMACLRDRGLAAALADGG
jgi:RNA polymerase sigma-70 factor (ECF subfamily)